MSTTDSFHLISGWMLEQMLENESFYSQDLTQQLIDIHAIYPILFVSEKSRISFSDTKEQLIYKSKNTECPITFEQIKYNESYLTCSACKYNFSEEAIVKHLNYKYEKNCPLCSGEWKDYCKYINKDTKIENLKKIRNFEKFEKTKKGKKGTKITSELIVGQAPKTKHNKKWYYGK